MPVAKVQVGQIWKKEETGQSFLITKLYNEALATFAVLRRTGAESEAPVRVRIERKGATQNLPGYTYAQESEEF